LPEGYSAEDYEPKDFVKSKLIQDFPLRGRAVFLRIKRRRWRHKTNGKVIKREFSFTADGSKFTQELSDFLKDTSEYATRYHEKYSQLLRD
jgi:transposase